MSGRSQAVTELSVGKDVKQHIVYGHIECHENDTLSYELKPVCSERETVLLQVPRYFGNVHSPVLRWSLLLCQAVSMLSAHTVPQDCNHTIEQLTHGTPVLYEIPFPVCPSQVTVHIAVQRVINMQLDNHTLLAFTRTFLPFCIICSNDTFHYSGEK